MNEWNNLPHRMIKPTDHAQCNDQCSPGSCGSHGKGSYLSPRETLATDFFECRFTLLEILDFQKLLKLSVDWLVVCSYRYEVMSELPPIPTELLPDLCSESAALRLLNLPTTKRDWLRDRLTGSPAGGAMIYKASDVLALGQELRSAPIQTPRKAPSGLQHGAPTRAGQPQLANRIGGQLETR